jgi:hypothetical protein
MRQLVIVSRKVTEDIIRHHAYLCNSHGYYSVLLKYHIFVTTTKALDGTAGLF